MPKLKRSSAAHRTRLAKLRKQRLRQNSEYREQERKSDVVRKRKQREDPVKRQLERELNTERRRQKRKVEWERERAERERAEQERAEQERAERERAERERVEQERAERERAERERVEREGEQENTVNSTPEDNTTRPTETVIEVQQVSNDTPEVNFMINTRKQRKRTDPKRTPQFILDMEYTSTSV